MARGKIDKKKRKMVVVLFSLGCVVAKPLKECEDYKKYLYFKISLNMIQMKGIFLTRIKKMDLKNLFNYL